MTPTGWPPCQNICSVLNQQSPLCQNLWLDGRRLSSRSSSVVARLPPSTLWQMLKVSALCSRSSMALEKVSGRLTHLAIPIPHGPPHVPDPSVTLSIPRGFGATELSLVTPRGSVDHQPSRSTLCDEDRGQLVDLSGSHSWGNEVLRDVVVALSPLPEKSKRHEERKEAIEAMCAFVCAEKSAATRYGRVGGGSPSNLQSPLCQSLWPDSRRLAWQIVHLLWRAFRNSITAVKRPAIELRSWSF